MENNFQVGDKAVSLVDGPRVMKMGESYPVVNITYCNGCNAQMIDIGFGTSLRAGRCNLCGGLWPTMGRKWVGSRFFMKQQELDSVLESVLENSTIVESIKS